jgi:hypothetical protein
MSYSSDIFKTDKDYELEVDMQVFRVEWWAIALTRNWVDVRFCTEI